MSLFVTFGIKSSSKSLKITFSNVLKEKGGVVGYHLGFFLHWLSALEIVYILTILIVNYGSLIPGSNTNQNILNKAKENMLVIFCHFLHFVQVLVSFSFINFSHL